jgi:drug/metabolite transporter (DMT)-like permease
MFGWRRQVLRTDTRPDVSSHSRRTSLIATFAGVTACLLGGTAAVATRYVLPETDALTVTFLRNGGAMALMLCLALATTRVRIRGADLPVVLGLGIVQFGLMQLLFVSAFHYMPAARGALVLSTMPIQTLILAALLRREQLTPLKVLGGLLAFAGVAVALGDRAAASGPEVWKGDLLMFGSAFCGALYNVLASIGLRKYPAVSVIAVQLPAGVAAIFVALLVTGDVTAITRLSLNAWLIIIYLMSLGGVLSFYLWIWALERIAPTSVAITITVNPISAAVLGAVLLGEPITLHMMIGLVGVVAGIILANWPSRRAASAIVPGPSVGR